MAAAKKEPTFIEALIALRADLPNLVFDMSNSHFRNKYISLAGVMESINPTLNKHGFLVTHTSYRAEDGAPWLRTALIHTSGERLESDLPISGSDPQKVGSAITYARRYSVLNLLGAVADEDDDAETAVGRGKAAGPKKPSEAQVKLIKTLLKKVRSASSKAAGDEVVQELVGKTLDDLTSKDATTLIDKLKEEEEARGGAF